MGVVPGALARPAGAGDGELKVKASLRLAHQAMQAGHLVAREQGAHFRLGQRVE